MWSLGCITVVLLTGGSAFEDPSTGSYSQTLANKCNLKFLDKSDAWRQVRTRPKEFVKRLLVLDEADRMTAQQALDDPWFSNEMHKTNFEDLYKRTIRHWHPRNSKVPVIQFPDSSSVKYLPCSGTVVDPNKGNNRARSPTPVEPPYKPFPRNMHISLWPTRSTGRRISEEVKKAMEESWSSDAMKPRTHSSSSRCENTSARLPVAAVPQSMEWHQFTGKNKLKMLLMPTQQAVTRTEPRKRTFKPLMPRPTLVRSSSWSNLRKRRNSAVADVSPAAERDLARENDQTCDPSSAANSAQPFVSRHFQHIIALRPSASSSDHPSVPKGTHDDSVPDSEPEFAVPHHREGSVDFTTLSKVDGFPTKASLQQNRLSPARTRTLRFSRACSVPPPDLRTPNTNKKLKPRSPSSNTSRVQTMSESRKRRKGSVFDLYEDDSDSDSNYSYQASGKRRRFNSVSKHHSTNDIRTQVQASSDGEDEITLPHHSRSWIENEDPETARAAYLPRV